VEMSANDGKKVPASDANATDTSAFTGPLVVHPAASLVELSSEEREAIEALPSGAALLIVRRGPSLGSRFLLDHDVSVAGRHPNCEIFLDDVTVSRRHCEFTRSAQGFEMHDLGSLNGTFVQGERVDRAALEDGCEVLVGKFHLTFYASRRDVVGGDSR